MAATVEYGVVEAWEVVVISSIFERVSMLKAVRV